MLHGTHAWFLWFLEYPENIFYRFIFYVTGSLISLLYCITNRIHLKFNVGILLLFICRLICGTFYPSKILVDFMFVFPLWVLINDKVHSEIILKRTINLLSAILIPGIILHVYMIVNGLIPGIPVEHLHDPSHYLFFNYGILLRCIADYTIDDLRFQSIFLEPGFIGTFIAFLLYAINYNFKKYKMAWGLLVGLFLTWSLAGYILTFIGYMWSKWSKQSLLKYSIVIILIGIPMFLFFKEYNSGNNPVNEQLFSRLEYDDEKGIKGNTRVGSGTDYYFEQSLLNGSIIFGMGPERVSKINGGSYGLEKKDYNTEIQGAGYKLFLVTFGLVAAVLYFMVYYYLGVKKCTNIRYSLGFFLLIFLAFLPTAYPDSYSWLIPFILGIQCNSEYYKKNWHENRCTYFPLCV